MNYIEAHMIVHRYGDTVGKGTDQFSMQLRPISLLYPFSKDEIIDAYKIFYAQMIYFHAMTQEQYAAYDMTLSSLNLFVDNNLYKDVVRCIKSGSKEAEKFSEKAIELNSGNYRRKEVRDYFEKMLQVKAGWIQKYKDGELSFMECLNHYCADAYTYANIDYKSDSDPYYFLSLETMRKNLNNERMLKYYDKYRDYILKNQ